MHRAGDFGHFGHAATGWADGGYAKYGPRGHDTLYVEFAAFLTNVKRVAQLPAYTPVGLRVGGGVKAKLGVTWGGSGGVGWA